MEPLKRAILPRVRSIALPQLKVGFWLVNSWNLWMTQNHGQAFESSSGQINFPSHKCASAKFPVQSNPTARPHRRSTTPEVVAFSVHTGGCRICHNVGLQSQLQDARAVLTSSRLVQSRLACAWPLCAWLRLQIFGRTKHVGSSESSKLHMCKMDFMRPGLTWHRVACTCNESTSHVISEFVFFK